MRLEMQMVPPLVRRAVLEMDMASCEQVPGVSVLRHGELVAQAFGQLISHLSAGTPLPAWWRLPAWAHAPALHAGLPSPAVLREYHVYHDCGKPYVRMLGIDGSIHFPGHAAASEAVWAAVGGNRQAGRLMGMDMDAHLMRPEDCAEFARRPEAGALLLTAIAEIHANAEMLGATQSDTFKAKAKRLASRGKAVVFHLEATSTTGETA